MVRTQSARRRTQGRTVVGVFSRAGRAFRRVPQHLRRRRIPFVVGCVLPLAVFVGASGQTTAHSVESVLGEHIQPSAVTAFQLQSYLTKRIPKLSPPSSSK